MLLPNGSHYGPVFQAPVDVNYLIHLFKVVATARKGSVGGVTVA